MKTHASYLYQLLILCPSSTQSKSKPPSWGLSALLSIALIFLPCAFVHADLKPESAADIATRDTSAPSSNTSLVSSPSPKFELHPHKAIYSAKIKKGLSIKGEATRELKRQGEHWLYRFDVDSIAANIKEQTLLDWHEGQVKPISYDYALSGFFIKERKRQIRFQWPKNKAAGKRNKDAWQLALSGGELERLGYQLQLGADFAQNKTMVDYRIVHKGRIENSQFQLVGQERIDTVLGKVDSRVVKKLRAADKKRETLLWFSIEQPLLLLKMTQKEKDGEEYEVQLKQLLHYDSRPAQASYDEASKPRDNQ